MRARDTWVVIAAHDDGGVIGGVVGGVRRGGWSVVVVDDGSRDDTSAAARAAGASVIRHAVSLGQGAALQTGIDHAVRRGAGHIVTFDGDGRHAPEDIAALVAALADADVALGSRFLGSVEGATRQRMMLLRTAVTVSSRLSGLRLSDARCGLRAFRAELAPRLRITQHRRAHASELLRKIERAGVRVVEVPCTLRYTAYSSKQGQGGLQAVRVLFDYFVRA